MRRERSFGQESLPGYQSSEGVENQLIFNTYSLMCYCSITKVVIMDEKNDKSTLGAIAGYQIGNMLSVAPGPLTGVKILVDHLAKDRSADYTETDVPVDENDTTSFQNQKNTSAKGGDNKMPEYEDPAELVAAAEEGEMTFEEYEAEVETYSDLSDEEAAYLGVTGAQLFLRDKVEDLEVTTEELLEVKYETDDLIDEVIEDRNGWREVYTAHLNEAAASIASSGDYVDRSIENVEEAVENLEGKNDQMGEALDNSPLEDLRNLEDRVNAALTEGETSEE